MRRSILVFEISLREATRYYRSVLLVVLGICWVSFSALIISVSSNNHFEQLPLWSRAGLTLVRTWLWQRVDSTIFDLTVHYRDTRAAGRERCASCDFDMLLLASDCWFPNIIYVFPGQVPPKAKQSKQTPKTLLFQNLWFEVFYPRNHNLLLPGTANQRKVRHKGSRPRPGAWHTVQVCHRFMAAASPTLETTLGSDADSYS